MATAVLAILPMRRGGDVGDDLARQLAPAEGPTEREPLESRPIDVRFSGCTHLLGPLEDPTCLRAPDEDLELWLPTVGPVEASLDGGPWRRVEGETRADGLLVRLQAPPEARRIAVRRPDEGAPPWRLRLRPDAAWAQKQRLQKEVGELLSSSSEAAADALRRELAAARDPAVRSFAASTLARLQSSLGDPEAASDSFRRAIAEHRRWHDVKREIDDGTRLFRVLFYDLEDVAAAGDLLDALPRSASGHMESEYLLAYTRGALARRTGDVRGALEQLAHAADLARRFDRKDWRAQSEQLLALQHTALGQHRTAEDLLDALLEIDRLKPCEGAHLQNAIAWQRLLARDAGRPSDDPLPLLRQAAEGLDGCEGEHWREERLNVELNLALARWQGGDIERAARHLEAATELTDRPRLRTLLWWRELQARVAMSRGQLGEARRLYRELAQLAARLSAPGAAWRAAIGEARALRAADRLDAAHDAYAEAEAHLDDAVRRVPVHVDRARSQAVRRAGIDEYLDLLLEQGRDAAALRVARRAMARSTRGLAASARLAEMSAEQRRRWSTAVLDYQAELRALDGLRAASWQLPADRLAEADLDRRRRHDQLARRLDDALSLLDRGRAASAELPPRRADELLLVYHPLGDGWVGFAADASAVVARRLGAIDVGADPPALAAGLLEPFRDVLGAGQRLRILAAGAVGDVDFHALPWNGDVLLAEHTVVYGLDAGRLDRPRRDRSTALLVADPTRTLAAAVAFEVPRLSAMLRGDPAWRVETLERPTAATLRPRLAEPDLFHFAGHAVLRGRTESYLDLADGSRLALGEVLTLPRVPAEVVLSACRGARPEAGEDGSGLSLAQAFGLAGADAVVAAVRPVDDAATSRLMIRLYAQRLRHPTLAEALRRAQLDLRRRAPDGEWASFRVLER